MRLFFISLSLFVYNNKVSRKKILPLAQDLLQQITASVKKLSFLEVNVAEVFLPARSIWIYLVRMGNTLTLK